MSQSRKEQPCKVALQPLRRHLIQCMTVTCVTRFFLKSAFCCMKEPTSAKTLIHQHNRKNRGMRSSLHVTKECKTPSVENCVKYLQLLMVTSFLNYLDIIFYGVR